MPTAHKEDPKEGAGVGEVEKARNQQVGGKKRRTWDTYGLRIQEGVEGKLKRRGQTFRPSH